MYTRLMRVCAVNLFLSVGVLTPTTLFSQEGNWRITNASVGSFAGWATRSGVRPLVGDFNGNGRDDVALIRQHSGWATMPVALSNGNGGWIIRNGGTGSFASWATRSGVRPLVGDFNGDGRDDVALIRQHGGWATMPVAFSNGNGGWIIRNGGTGSFASWATRSGVRPLVGDFNGDGRDDVALLRQNSGWATMPVAFSNGSGGWTIRNRGIGSFASWATRSRVRPLVGDYNGDGRDDVALIRQDTGWATIPVAFAQGSGNWQVTNRSAGSFAGWATRSGVTTLVGDFDGNGRDDIALIRRVAGWATMPVAFGAGGGNWTIRNGGIGSFASWATRSGVIPLVGDYNRDGRDDVALIRRVAGWATMPVAFAAGSGNWSVTNRTSSSFAGWATRSGVRTLVGDFTGDGRSDVALLRQNGGWATIPVAAATNVSPVTTRRLTVARHNNATGSNALADNILTAASNVLQTNDGAGDVACPVAFTRQGNMTVFSNTDGTLNSSAELNTVFSLAPDMKIVPAVDFCANQFNTSYIGCGQIGRFNLIIERFTASQEGILWAHEIGHNVGLNHRNDTSNALMFPSIGSNRQRITQAECNSFLSGGAPLVAASSGGDTGGIQIASFLDEDLAENLQMELTQELLETLASDPMMQSEPDADMYNGLGLQDSLDQSAAMDGGAGLMSEEADETMGITEDLILELAKDPMMQTVPEDSMVVEGDAAPEQSATVLGRTAEDGPLPPVVEFVRQIYFEGLPLARAAEYGQEDIAPLVAILNDPAEVIYHENAALTIGMIGEAASVEPLISYIERSDGVSPPSDATEVEVVYFSKGRVAAVVALGYAANLAESSDAVNFLIDRVQGGLLGAEALDDPEDAKLVEYAIIALGFSGSAEAGVLLERLEERRVGAESLDGAEVDFGSAVEAGLGIRRQISEDGLLNYYKPRQ